MNTHVRISAYAIPGLKFREHHANTYLKLKAEHIIEIVEAHFQLEKNAMFRRNRKREIIVAKQISILLIKSYSLITLTGIGTIFRMHHSSIIHNIRAAKDMMEVDKEFKKFYKEIETKIIESL